MQATTHQQSSKADGKWLSGFFFFLFVFWGGFLMYLFISFIYNTIVFFLSCLSCPGGRVHNVIITGVQ